MKIEDLMKQLPYKQLNKVKDKLCFICSADNSKLAAVVLSDIPNLSDSIEIYTMESLIKKLQENDIKALDLFNKAEYLVYNNIGYQLLNLTDFSISALEKAWLDINTKIITKDVREYKIPLNLVIIDTE